ncbi:MAG: tyrosine-type recombinase/integrase [Desulfohalobiaceae bacterium]|nr:tyrosine-type recombinase/integrase [Desulfohalobiaceae bacterium]
MSLNDVKIKALKPGDKPYRVADSEGLYLEVTTTGSKLWRLKYRFGNKQKTLALGKYPEITLAAARDKKIIAKRQLAEGIDPNQVKKHKKAEQSNTFGIIALEWFGNQKPKWKKGHAQTILRRLEKNVFPWMKDRPIREITTREILEVLRRMEARGAVDSAHRVGQFINQIFLYAVASARAETNPAADINKALKVIRTRQLPAITEPNRIKDLLKAIDGFEGSFVVHSALRIAPLVFVRPGELRHAEWTEIDFENSTWTLPADKMKMKREHVVPLSKQALQILEDLYPLTGSGGYVFPSIRTPARPMSENTLNVALMRLGFSKEEHCPHGFRSMASTRLHEMGWDSRVIEVQLAHVDRNKIRGIYNRAEYLDDRTRMMQAWADYLEGLKSGAKVLTINGNKAIN